MKVVEKNKSIKSSIMSILVKTVNKLLNFLRLFLSAIGLYRPALDKLVEIKAKKHKKNRRVTFLVYQSAVWKSDGIYNFLNNCEDIEVSITILPIINDGKVSAEDLQRTKNFFLGKEYNTSIIFEDQDFIKAKNYFNHIDTIVFSDCWNLSSSLLYYYLILFKDCVYVPYSHQVSKYDNFQSQYNQIIHNLVRSIYAPHDYEYEIFDKFSKRKNDNVKFLGYPGVSNLVRAYDAKKSCKNYEHLLPKNPWQKFSNKKAKNLIWAPHHSINWKDRKYSNFLDMCELMLDFASKYEREINFAFKPHPMLKEILIEKWGREKTYRYYDEWKKKPNCTVQEGDYEALFFYSDILIHDCGSFLAEYTYLDKTHIFVKSSEEIRESFNKFGKLCMDNIISININEISNKKLDEILLQDSNNKTPKEAFSKSLREKSSDSDIKIALDIIMKDNCEVG